MTVKVPNTSTFSLQDVYNAVNYHANPSGDLADCFSKSVASYFDPNYDNNTYAPANSMLRFRNYFQPDIQTLVLGSGTDNHWGLTSLPPAPNALGWDGAVHDAELLNVLAGKQLTTGYAGHHNNDISPPTTRIHRCFLEFDTSVIPDDAIIESVSLRLYAGVLEHDLAPALAPVNTHVVSLKDMPASFSPFVNIDAYQVWNFAGAATSVGNFLCDDWAFKTYNINIDASAINKVSKTWIIPRLMYWDYTYDTGNGVPTYLRAIKFDASKTSTNKPQLTINYR